LSNPFHQNIDYSHNIGRWNKIIHVVNGTPTEAELEKYPMYDVS
jgi:hypothetical protein